MHKVFRLVTRITSLIFLFILVYVYAFLPETLELKLTGVDTLKVNREHFFYGVLVFFILSSLLLALLKKFMERIPTSPKVFITEARKSGLLAWAEGMGAVINLFLTFTVSFIGMNHNSEHFNINHFVFLVYLGPFMIIGWFFYLIYLLIFTPKTIL